MVATREEAARKAESMVGDVFKVGTCQLVTRGIFDAPSVGDVDGDHDADAVDGYKSEPISARHTGTNAPRGTPGAWAGGSNGYGHRAISLGDGWWGSTDVGDGRRGGQPGVYGKVRFEWFEENWSKLAWLGWTDTISGIPIPHPEEKPKVATQVQIGRRHLNRALRRAKKNGKTDRAAAIQKALDILPRR